MNAPDFLYVGVKGRVAAIRKSDGSIVWQTVVQDGFMGDDFVSLLIESGRVFAHTRGALFCLDAASGEVLWKNGLPGFGYGIAMLATRTATSDLTAAAARVTNQRQNESSAATAAS